MYEGFGIFNGHLLYFKAILMLSWYIFPCFGMLYREKSGNSGGNLKLVLNFSNGSTLAAGEAS
jgi:hypothetical protein